MINIDDKLKKEIGNRLIRLRKNKGKTLNNVIEIMNTNYNIDLNERSLRRYESGESIPKIDNLICLADYYGVSLDYLIYGKETSDDNLLNWEQSFRRLHRLIYTFVLIPFKDTTQDSEYYNKYYFISHDSEVSAYLDKFTAYFAEKNNNFIKTNEPFFETPSSLDNLISDSVKNDNSILIPSLARIEKYIDEYKDNPDAIFLNTISRVMKVKNNK